MTITTLFKKKIAPLAAALVLVASGFASGAHAQTNADLQAQINALLAQIQSLQAQLAAANSSATACEFTRSLTIGVSGSDVTCLQTYLIGHGYSIPAGATGYFGVQTRAAVASWQAANGVAPAVGYFGPISRAKYSAIVVITPPINNGGGSGGTVTLHGGEADLTRFKLIAENGSIREGDTKQKVATAQFDVSGGDVNVQRADLEFTANSSSYDVKPWKYVDTISVYDGSTKVGSIDASNQDAWDKTTTGTTPTYKISVTNLSDVVREGDTANLTFEVDSQSSIDSVNNGQSFNVDVPDQGIRAVDAAGIQQYVGNASDTVRVDVEAAVNGKLTVRESSNDPNAGVLVADDISTVDNLSVFAFDIRNSSDTDTRVTDLTIDVATASPSGSPAANITDIIRRATLTIDGKSYDGNVNTDNTIDFTDMDAIVNANDSTTGTLKISLYGQSNHFASTGESLTFSLPHGNVTAEGASSGDSVTSSDITGTANGNTQSISLNSGATVSGTSDTTSLVYNSNDPSASYGTFTLKFNVTAVGDDIYVPNTAAPTSGSTTYAGVIYDPDMGASTSGGSVVASLSSTAGTSGTYGMYVIHAGDTETFTLTVTVNPSADGDYETGLDKIKFSATNDLQGLQTFDIDQTENQFHTDPLHIPNS